MDVVLGGSRNLSFMPELVGSKVADLINQSAYFLVGDAPGSDWAFQKYLYGMKYEKVEVFSSAGEIRHNVGHWKATHVDSGLKSKSSAVHAFKDRHMTKIAGLGIMIWDGESAGTLSNVIDLLDHRKECYLYMGSDQDFFLVDNRASLDRALVKFPEVYEEAQKRLATFHARAKKRAASEQDTQTLF